jgi:uncharacterized membrane protein (UPF0127 family)
MGEMGEHALSFSGTVAGSEPIINISGEDGRAVCERCLHARRAWPRMRGLLGRRELPPGEGVLLEPASSIHMMFMRFPIDAVFLDRELRVLRVAEGLRPWRFAACRGARSVLEIAAGEAAARQVRPGGRLRIG